MLPTALGSIQPLDDHRCLIRAVTEVQDGKGHVRLHLSHPCDAAAAPNLAVKVIFSDTAAALYIMDGERRVATTIAQVAPLRLDYQEA